MCSVYCSSPQRNRQRCESYIARALVLRVDDKNEERVVLQPQVDLALVLLLQYFGYCHVIIEIFKVSLNVSEISANAVRDMWLLISCTLCKNLCLGNAPQFCKLHFPINAAGM